MELLDVVDENNNLTGIVKDRDFIHKNGLYHREIGCWIINTKGEILIQKRAATKKVAPNLWAIVAGHVDAGETLISTAIREIKEEVGIDINKEDLEYLYTYKNNLENKHNFNSMYLITVDTKIEDFIIQEDELSEVKYISIDEFRKIIETKDKDYVFSDRVYSQKILEILEDKVRKINGSDNI